MPTCAQLVFSIYTKLTTDSLSSHIHTESHNKLTADLHLTHRVCTQHHLLSLCVLYLPEKVQTLFPLQLVEDEVKGIPACELLFCYQHLAFYHLLSGWKIGGRVENLLINAEHKEVATQTE